MQKKIVKRIVSVSAELELELDVVEIAHRGGMVDGSKGDCTEWSIQFMGENVANVRRIDIANSDKFEYFLAMPNYTYASSQEGDILNQVAWQLWSNNRLPVRIDPLRIVFPASRP